MIAAATSINYTASTPGTYTCKVTKTASGCNTISNPVLVSIPCKEMEELISSMAFDIFPNPTNGFVTIQSNIPVVEGQVPIIIITNSMGQIIYNERSNLNQFENTQTINLLHIPNGVYQITLFTGNFYKTETIIKQ
ncbi:MAG: T9SS type A sorting domain-containing protein [Bacteroidetes bacterium]|nr:T9SS type A sorting domain-containing protein [Bacteroidota bacterium]